MRFYPNFFAVYPPQWYAVTMKKMDEIYDLQHIMMNFNSMGHWLVLFDDDDLEWFKHIYGVKWNKCIKTNKKWTVKDQSDLIHFLAYQYNRWRKRQRDNNNDDDDNDFDDKSDNKNSDDDNANVDDNDDNNNNDEIILDDTLVCHLRLNVLRNRYSSKEILNMLQTLTVVHDETTKFVLYNSFLFFFLFLIHYDYKLIIICL